MSPAYIYLMAYAAVPMTLSCLLGIAYHCRQVLAAQQLDVSVMVAGGHDYPNCILAAAHFPLHRSSVAQVNLFVALGVFAYSYSIPAL